MLRFVLGAGAAGAAVGAALLKGPQKCCALCWLLGQRAHQSMHHFWSVLSGLGQRAQQPMWFKFAHVAVQGSSVYDVFEIRIRSDATSHSVARKHGACQAGAASAAQIRALLDSAEETGCVIEAEGRGAVGEECKVSKQSI